MKVMTLDFKTEECDQVAVASMSFGNYEIFMGRSPWCAELQFGANCVILSKEVGVNKEQAIKICHEDFKQRVLACLDAKS
ncbi:conserved hypothetical protein [Vibrio crassostreae]|nr:conserved hypothetical protein [Vibrio crassostreae]